MMMSDGKIVYLLHFNHWCDVYGGELQILRDYTISSSILYLSLSMLTDWLDPFDTHCIEWIVSSSYTEFDT
jgi:hypothetical protein